MATALTAGRRDARIIGIIGIAHLLSHFFQLILPPLFPFIRDETGLGYDRLGLVMGIFYATSGSLQTPAGFLVDRIGARPVLFAGLALLTAASATYAFAPGYGALIALAVVAGMGNSVFHPADYSLINSTISPTRIGRAYSIHGVGGQIGYAVAPPLMFALGSLLGWRTAALVAGLVGLVLAALLFTQRDELRPPADKAAGGPHAAGSGGGNAIAMLLQSRMIVFLLFFFLFAFATIGLQNFTAIALAPVTGLPLLTTNVALTGFLIGSPVGILAGGWLADATPRHGLIATVGFVLAGLMVVGVPNLDLPPALLVAGFTLAGLFVGVALPSRDLVVRAASPPGASGKVFGFVYSGLDAGASLGPTVFGLLVSKGFPHAIFLVAAGLFMVSALIIHLPALVDRWRAGAGGGGR